MLEETSRGNFLEFLSHFAGGHICDHIRAESEPSCCRFPSQQCLNSTMSLISRTAGTEGVRHSVWCFSRWLEAWPKKPQYGAAYLVMNAVISVHGTYHPVLILKDGNLHLCCMFGLDTVGRRTKGRVWRAGLLWLWLTISISPSPSGRSPHSFLLSSRYLFPSLSLFPNQLPKVQSNESS